MRGAPRQASREKTVAAPRRRQRDGRGREARSRRGRKRRKAEETQNCKASSAARHGAIEAHDKALTRRHAESPRIAPQRGRRQRQCRPARPVRRYSDEEEGGGATGEQPRRGNKRQRGRIGSGIASHALQHGQRGKGGTTKKAGMPGAGRENRDCLRQVAPGTHTAGRKQHGQETQHTQRPAKREQSNLRKQHDEKRARAKGGEMSRETEDNRSTRRSASGERKLTEANEATSPVTRARRAPVTGKRGG